MDSMSSGGMVTTTERRREWPVVYVGMDLDGVHYVFERAYYETLVALGEILDPRPWAKRPYPVAAPKPGARPFEFREAGTWTFYETYGHNAEQFKDICHAGADLGIIFGPQEVDDAAKAAWRAIKEAGHEIHVKTSRFFGSHPAVSHANTRHWLYTEGLPYDSLTFCTDKMDGPPVDMMLEDNVDNYDNLDAGGVEVWLIDRPWNQDADHGGIERRRVFSHGEFLTRVLACSRRKKAIERAVAEMKRDGDTKTLGDHMAELVAASRGRA